VTSVSVARLKTCIKKLCEFRFHIDFSAVRFTFDMKSVASYRSLPEVRSEMPGVLAVVPATLAIVFFTPVIQDVISRVFRGSARSNPLSPLRRAVLGQRRLRIQSMLGPPRAASSGGVWYYPVSNTDRVAMAISFRGDRATAVDFFRSPV
jgi:hypothetical protein